MATKSQFPEKSAPSCPHANARNLSMPIRMAKMRKTPEKKRKVDRGKNASMLAVVNAITKTTTRPINKINSQSNLRMKVPPKINHSLQIKTELITETRREVAVLAEAEQTETEAVFSAATAEVAEEAEGDLGDTTMTSICSRASAPKIS